MKAKTHTIWRVLMHQGVPPDAIRTLEPPIVNTATSLRRFL